MDIYELSLNLKTYLRIIGAEIVTRQSEYGGKWESRLVRKDLPTVSFSIGYFPGENAGKMEYKEFVAEGSSPETAIKKACEMIKNEKIFFQKIEFYFPFKELTT
jgi:hypothetical protein